jgi:hypothetical protein
MLRLACIVIMLSGTCHAAISAPADATGYAYDREKGTPLYSEHHFRQYEDGQLKVHRVEYRTPQGRLFAEKKLAYADHPFAPNFLFKDRRDQYEEGAEWESKAYRLFHAADRQSGKVVEHKPDLVCDAGFDRFIRARLEQLSERRAQQLTLAIPGALKAFRFEVSTVGIDADRGEIHLEALPASLLKVLVKPIRLTYDLRSGELRRYVGMSNIRNFAGERYDARIEFPASPGQPFGFSAAP